MATPTFGIRKFLPQQGATGAGLPTALPTTAPLPDPVVAHPGLARPSILVRGMSGTGKTKGASDLLAAGLCNIVLDIEDKAQSLFQHNPLTIFVNENVVVPTTGLSRPPTIAEKYARLLEFEDKLGSGYYHKFTGGRPLDFFIGDGVMELLRVFYAYHEAHAPVSAKTGNPDILAAYGIYGRRGVMFMSRCRHAASQASGRPVGQYWTVGEKWHRQSKPTDMYTGLDLCLPGNVVPDELAYIFEAVLRLSIRRNSDGSATYLCDTVGNPDLGFEAKVPAGCTLPPVIENWNMHDIYRSIQDAYAGGAAAPTSGQAVGTTSKVTTLAGTDETFVPKEH